MPLTTEEAIRRYAYQYQAPVPIRPAPEAPALSLGLEGQAGRLDDSPGRGEPASAGGRAAGRPRTDHDAHDQPQRGGPARLAWPRHSGSPGRAAAAGRADGRRGRVRRVHSGSRTQRGRLLAADLSWYRIMSRDAGLAIAAPASRQRARCRIASASPTRVAPPTDPEAAENELNRLPAWPIGATRRDFPGSPATCSKRLRASRSPARTSCCGSSSPI